MLQLLCSPIGNQNFRKKTKQNITNEGTPHSVPEVTNGKHNVIDQLTITRSRPGQGHDRGSDGGEGRRRLGLQVRHRQLQPGRRHPVARGRHPGGRQLHALGETKTSLAFDIHCRKSSKYAVKQGTELKGHD